jgi:RNA polymerase sigma-70 factor (ECF subfamily)
MARTKRITDRDLVEQFKSGSIEAFEEIVSRHESKVYNLALRYTRNPEDAEEVLQDVFTTVYRKIEGFQGKSAFSSWLYRIIVNAAFMKLRKRKQKHAISIEDLSPSARQKYVDNDEILGRRSDFAAMDRELRDIMQRAIDRLPDQYRAVFILRDIDGLSNQEVSEILDLTIPAVKSRLHRSRLMLRKKLQHYYYEGRDTANIKPVDMPLEPQAIAM